MTVSKMLAEHLGRLVLSPRLQGVALGYLGRPFSRSDSIKVAVYFDVNAITFAQVFPFLHYAAEFRAVHKAEFRFFAMQGLLSGPVAAIRPADKILLMPWFTIEPADLARALDLLRRTSPAAAISFVDSFAHNDLRLAPILKAEIAWYVKKSLFRDRGQFLRPHRGHTNLTEFFGDHYGIALPVSDWEVPESFLGKLRLGPGFFTAQHFLGPFARPGPPGFDNRQIDLHMRLGVKGLDWYSAMRADAIKTAQAIGGIATTPTHAVPNRQYVRELRQSKLCFSPFGYGELCWRDIEAFAYGSVLIKPDMSHLETSPDIFVPGVTYLPVRWDFADLAEVVETALRSPDLCRSITREAHRRIAAYLQTAQFVRDMAFLFD